MHGESEGAAGFPAAAPCPHSRKARVAQSGPAAPPRDHPSRAGFERAIVAAGVLLALLAVAL